MKASSLRPVIVRVMWEYRGSPFSTAEIYDLVAATGVPGFDARAKRDRNLVNRDLSDLAGMSSNSHAKPAPHLLTQVGRGRYIFREPEPRPPHYLGVQQLQRQRQESQCGPKDGSSLLVESGLLLRHVL